MSGYIQSTVFGRYKIYNNIILMVESVNESNSLTLVFILRNI